MSQSELESLIDETRRLFHHLRAAAETLHSDERVSVAHRAVLENLARGGPKTVPSLARERSVSRQHVQVLVNHLLAIGLVEAKDNPASARSPIIDLTAAGRDKIRAMLRRERRALPAAKLPVSGPELRAAAATLRSLREFLASELSGPLGGERARRRAKPAGRR